MAVILPSEIAPVTVARVRIRPMVDADIDAAERLTDETWFAYDLATRPADWPPPTRRDLSRREEWRRRCAHLIDHDPGGCWVAEDSSGLLGVATSLRRESWWGLSSYFVLPDTQGSGVGRALLDAALRHAEGAPRGMICATHDPRAFRRYRLAGFTLHPGMLAWGSVDRSAIPVLGRVRDGSAADIELCEDVDRRTRGAGHGVDHEVLRTEHALIVVDDATRRGYCYVLPHGGAEVLAATDPGIAAELLWESLARSEPGADARFLFATAEQEWAIDVALAARLEIHGRGYLAYRGMRPAMPYLPSTYFL